MSAAIDDRAYRTALYNAAMTYISQGIPVIPIGRIDYGPDGKKTGGVPALVRWSNPANLVTRPDQVEKWFGLIGQAQGIAIATGELFMLDSDQRGADAAEPPAGAWVERHAGRGGWHAYMRNPAGARNTAGAIAAGIDTRGVGGLSVAAPTRCFHADGSVTQWLADRPMHELNVSTLADAPEVARELAPARPLTPVGTATEMTRERADAAVAQWRDRWLTSVHGELHHTMRDYVATLARYELAMGTPYADLQGTLEAAIAEHPYVKDGYVMTTAEGILASVHRYAAEKPWVIVEPSGFEARFSANPESAPVVKQAAGALPTLAASFWEARPVLTHIRDAAWSRRLAPDAVLHAVLARLAAGRRAVIRIDSGIEDSSLNYFAAIVGVSGAGKSRAWKLASRLLDLDFERCPTRPLGSGEGMSEAFMGTVASVHPETLKATKERVQVRHNVLFEMDEGQALTAMLSRAGATIGPALRSAWSGAVLGQQNADADRNRRVDGYATGLVAGFQPDAMQALIQDTHTGMPQRFAFVAASDASMPKERPAYPGALPTDLTGVLCGGSSNPFAPGAQNAGEVVSVPDEVTDELDAALLAVGSGAVAPAELDSQKIAMMLRFAGLLALLEGRFAVSMEDWALAGALWAVSAAVRDALVARAIETAERARDSADGHYAVRQARAAAAVGGVDKAVRRIAAKLAQHVRAEGGLTMGAARQCLASRDRGLFDSAVEFGEGESWLTLADGALSPGTSQPG